MMLADEFELRISVLPLHCSTDILYVINVVKYALYTLT
jgi:hypothetical protein